MQRLRAWASRDPGLALVVIAMIVTTVLYAPTLGYGLVHYDDPWLIRDNWIVSDLSFDSLHRIVLDLSPEVRRVLGDEYLPVRDLSVMLDHAIWGTSYGGYHLTNLVLYLAALALVFRMLAGFGFDRTVLGIALLLFAIHPVHAESVSWLSERKGLLGLVFAAVTGIAYVRFRHGGSWKWLVLATVTTIAAVWSKAPAAFTIASLAGLELVAPTRRITWRRSAVGLATIALAGILALVPVVMLATRTSVLGESPIPGGAAETALGVHGFYLQLVAMTTPNAISYPISNLGPSTLELVLGLVGLLAIGCALVPRFPIKPEIRAAAIIWVCAFLPIGHVLVSVREVGVADRYALVLVLGPVLAIASVIRMIPRRQLQIAVVAVLAGAAGVRTLDARASWSNTLLLAERAIDSNPHDATMWSAYIVALDEAGMPEQAERAVEIGLHYTRAPRLLRRRALDQLAAGDRAQAIATMREAAYGRDVIAAGDLAQLLLGDQPAEALHWGRLAAAVSPTSPHAQRSHGVVALGTGHPAEALEAFASAYELEHSTVNAFNRAIALRALGRTAEAIPFLKACLDDPGLGPRARTLLAESGVQ